MVVGKHQNTLAEIDIDIVKKQGIKVVRRLSGGGAVYHDLGNLNFTFIKNGKEGKMVDFKGYTEPIIAALAKIGLEAKFEGHNNLTINGLKYRAMPSMSSNQGLCTTVPAFPIQPTSAAQPFTLIKTGIATERFSRFWQPLPISAITCHNP